MKKPVQKPGPDAEPETFDVEAREVEGVDPHRVESLQEIARDAERLEAPPGDETGQPGATGAAGPSAAPVDPENAPGVADLVNVLELVREVSEPMLTEAGIFHEGQIGAIWDEGALRRIAAPVVQICDRHGVAMGEALDRFGPYVALTIGLLAPALATYKVVKINKAAKGEGDGQQREA